MREPIPASGNESLLERAHRTGQPVKIADLLRGGATAGLAEGETPDSPPEKDEASHGSDEDDGAVAESSPAEGESLEVEEPGPTTGRKRRGKGRDGRISQLVSERNQMRAELDQLRGELQQIRTEAARNERRGVLSELLGSASAESGRGEGKPATAKDPREAKALPLAAIHLAREEIDDTYPDLKPAVAREAAQILAAASLRGLSLDVRAAVGAAQAMGARGSAADELEGDADHTETVSARSRSARTSAPGKGGATRTEQDPATAKQRELKQVLQALASPRLHPAERLKLSARRWQLQIDIQNQRG